MDSSFWTRVKNKTSVSKSTIVELAKRLEKDGLKNKDALNEVIDTLSKITGKNIDEGKKEKIISKVCDDDVPQNIDKMF